MTIKELENAATIANRECYDYERMVEQIRRERVAEFENALRDNLKALHGDKIAALRETAHVANAALEKAKSEAAAAGVDAPYPLGTRFAEWELPKWRYGPDRKWKPTGRIAVVTAITSENTHELTRKIGYSAWNRVGEYVLRLLKKDGTPSAMYTSVSNWDFCPEGEDRNTWSGLPKREQEIAL